MQKALLDLEDAALPPEEEPEPSPPAEAAGDAPAAPIAEIAGQPELAAFLADHSLDRLVSLAETDIDDVRDAARLLTDAENVVIVWGERLGHGERGPEALRALRDLALLLGLDAAPGSGLIEVPAETNGRGLREMGFVAGLGPGYTVAPPGMSAAQARNAALESEVKAFYLLRSDPMRTHPGRALWEEALGSAFVVAHDQFLTESLERHADVVFPAEAYPEKEGTVTHPDGRVQRLRPAVGHPGEVRSEWRVLVELARRLGMDVEAHVGASTVFAEIAERVAPYSGMTLDEIGGKGLRWPTREASVEAVSGVLGELAFDRPATLQGAAMAKDGVLRLATAPSVWGTWVTEHSPSLRFMRPRQELELNPRDADALGLSTGDRARVGANGSALDATVRVRAAVTPGTALLTEGIAEDNATALADGTQRMVEVRRSAPESA
jgi:NADH-quinone oxidoreductase subunit G